MLYVLILIPISTYNSSLVLFLILVFYYLNSFIKSIPQAPKPFIKSIDKMREPEQSIVDINDEEVHETLTLITLHLTPCLRSLKMRQMMSLQNTSTVYHPKLLSPLDRTLQKYALPLSLNIFYNSHYLLSRYQRNLCVICKILFLDLHTTKEETFH